MRRHIIFLILFILAVGLWFNAGYKKGHTDGYVMADKKMMDLHKEYDRLSNNTPCGNVSKYITGSFMSDVYEIRSLAWDCKNNVSDKEHVLYNVDYLGNCSGVHIDCEDASFMIDCIAREYNISCEYYTYFGINTPNHRGINCNVSGVIKELY